MMLVHSNGQVESRMATPWVKDARCGFWWRIICFKNLFGEWDDLLMLSLADNENETIATIMDFNFRDTTYQEAVAEFSTLLITFKL